MQTGGVRTRRGGGGATGASRSSWMYCCRVIGVLVGTLGGGGSTAPSCSGMVALDVGLFCAGTGLFLRVLVAGPAGGCVFVT